MVQPGGHSCLTIIVSDGHANRKRRPESWNHSSIVDGSGRRAALPGWRDGRDWRGARAEQARAVAGAAVSARSARPGDQGMVGDRRRSEVRARPGQRRPSSSWPHDRVRARRRGRVEGRRRPREDLQGRRDVAETPNQLHAVSRNASDTNPRGSWPSCSPKRAPSSRPRGLGTRRQVRGQPAAASLLDERGLAQVIGDVRRAAEEHRQPVAQRILREILVGDRGVLARPVFGRELVEGRRSGCCAPRPTCASDPRLTAGPHRPRCDPSRTGTARRAADAGADRCRAADASGRERRRGGHTDRSTGSSPARFPSSVDRRRAARRASARVRAAASTRAARSRQRFVRRFVRQSYGSILVEPDGATSGPYGRPPPQPKVAHQLPTITCRSDRSDHAAAGSCTLPSGM